MAISTSRLAYSDCFDLLDKAVADHKGIRIKFASFEDAFYFRLRIHQARRIDRIENREVYDKEHPMHGRSPYDQITCKIRRFDGGAWLRLERIDTREFEVESLSDDHESETVAEMAPITVVIQNRERTEPVVVQPIRFKRRI